MIGSTAVTFACDKDDAPDSNAPVEVDSLGLFPDSTQVSADGSSIVTINATTNAHLHPAGTLVTVAASDGTFLPSGNFIFAATDANGRARAQLKATTDIVVSRLTATLGNLMRVDSVRFVRSLPDFLTLTAGAAGTPLTVTVARNVGAVSPGQQVRVNAYIAQSRVAYPGVSISPSVVVAGGASGGPLTATVTMLADTITAPAGLVTILAQTDGTTGTLKDSVTLRIAGPTPSTPK